MTMFLIIMELIVLLLLLSMIYSVAQLGREYRDKIRNLNQAIMSMDRILQKHERQITELKDKEVSEE